MLKLTHLQKSIILTLAYTTQFGYPLTTSELWMRLLACKPAFSDFAEAMRCLKNEGLIRSNLGYWSLDDESQSTVVANQLASQRKRRRLISQHKVGAFKPVVIFAQLCPWVMGMAITGSTAVDNATAKDDVDVMVVAENNRLWLARPLLIALAFCYGKRRTWQGEEPDSWCFNLWLERRSVQLDFSRRNVYSAYEACQTRWLVSKGGVKREFFQTNRWIYKILPNYFQATVYTPALHGYTENTGRLPLVSHLLDMLNLLAYQLQKLYMKKHITTEKVTYSTAFFHPRNTGKIIYSGWYKQFGEE